MRLSQVRKQKKELQARHEAAQDALMEEQDKAMKEFLSLWENEYIPELEERETRDKTEMRR